jgi:hypothetical protein
MATIQHFTVDLFDEGDRGAGFKFLNEPGQLQRRNVLDRGSDASVQVELMAVVHGKEMPTGSPATLIITEFRFLSPRGFRRFREATLNFTFFPDESSEDRPAVVNIGPNYHHTMDPVVVAVETRKTQTMGISLSPSIPAGAGISAGLEYERAHTTPISIGATITGSIRVENPQRRPYVKDAVRFQLSENPSQRDGLPTCVRTVVLIKRRKNSRFRAMINVHTQAEPIISSFRDSVRRLSGHMKVDPIIFDPALPAFGNCLPDQLDKDKLSSVDLNSLWKVHSTTIISTIVDSRKDGTSKNFSSYP